MQSNNKGQVRAKLYSGGHWDTVEAVMQPDGTATLAIRFMEMTNKGESIIGTGTGLQQAPDDKGRAKLTGEGTMWTPSPRLAQLNGARWVVEGDYDLAKESVEVRGTFDTSATS